MSSEDREVFDMTVQVATISREPEFRKFGKIPRWSRDIVITEKIDGTNGLVYISDHENPFLEGGEF